MNDFMRPGDDRKTRVALIGGYPPPFGGISIFIKRFSSNLEKTGKYSVTILNTNNLNKVKTQKIRDFTLSTMVSLFFSNKYDILHVNAYSRKYLIYYLMLPRHARVVLTLHGYGLYDKLHEGNEVERALIKSLMKKCAAIVCVNEDVLSKYQAMGFLRDRFHYIPAYIHPECSEGYMEDMPPQVRELLSGPRKIISANASNLDFHDGQEIYGIDLLVEMGKMLEGTRQDVAIIIYISQNTNPNHFQELVNSKASNTFIFQGLNHEFFPVISKSDIFIRPTRYDGYPLSIAESIYLGTPVIASDVVPRPDGVILFKTNDIKDMIEKVKGTLEHLDDEREKLKAHAIQDNTSKLLRLYDDVLKKG